MLFTTLVIRSVNVTTKRGHDKNDHDESYHILTRFIDLKVTLRQGKDIDGQLWGAAKSNSEVTNPGQLNNCHNSDREDEMVIITMRLEAGVSQLCL